MMFVKSRIEIDTILNTIEGVKVASAFPNTETPGDPLIVYQRIITNVLNPSTSGLLDEYLGYNITVIANSTFEAEEIADKVFNTMTENGFTMRLAPRSDHGLMTLTFTRTLDAETQIVHGGN